MKKLGMIATLACAVAMIGATPAASNPPEGQAYGYWAGRICDALMDYQPGVGHVASENPYWVNEGYKNRGQCVSAHIGYLQGGGAVPELAQ